MRQTSPARIEKQALFTCPVCSPAESMHWLVRAARAMTHGDGPPSAQDVRAYRRAFEAEMLAHRPTLDADDLHRWWKRKVERNPLLRTPPHRPPVPVSGLILYVLCAIVNRVLDHASSVDRHDRDQHFSGEFVRQIVTLGHYTPRYQRRVLEGLLGLERGLVTVRLNQRALLAELTDARQRGAISWVSPEMVLWAARYQGHPWMIEKLEDWKAVASIEGISDWWNKQIIEALRDWGAEPITEALLDWWAEAIKNLERRQIAETPTRA